MQTQGVVTQAKSTAILQIISLTSKDDRYDALFLNNFATLNLQNELARVDGVGGVTVFGVGEYSMRIWIDPGQMQARSLVPTDVVNALKEQNAEVTAGQVGSPPAAKTQAFQLTVNANGELNTVEEFEDIIVKSDTQNGGQITRLRDVARVELGAVSYRSSPITTGTRPAASRFTSSRLERDQDRAARPRQARRAVEGLPRRARVFAAARQHALRSRLRA